MKKFFTVAAFFCFTSQVFASPTQVEIASDIIKQTLESEKVQAAIVAKKLERTDLTRISFDKYTKNQNVSAVSATYKSQGTMCEVSVPVAAYVSPEEVYTEVLSVNINCK